MNYNSPPDFCVSSPACGYRPGDRRNVPHPQERDCPMPRITLLFLLALALAGCQKGTDAEKKGAAAAAPLLISAEDMHTVRNTALTSGPSVTGSIQPERRADLRAEVPAI